MTYLSRPGSIQIPKGAEIFVEDMLGGKIISIVGEPLQTSAKQVAEVAAMLQ